MSALTTDDERIRRRLCVVTTHPIQYIAPWFRLLAQRSDLDLHVIFFRQLEPVAQGIGFGRAFAWDIPLLTGYSNETVNFTINCKPTWSRVRRLRRALVARSPDVVLVTGWNEPMLVVAQLVARAQGVPVIVRGESNLLRRRRLLTRMAHRVLQRLPTGFLSIGRANRAFYESAGVTAPKLFNGPYFVENERLLAMAREHECERDLLRRTLGLARNDFVFAFCGKHVSFKRPALLLEAAAVLRVRGLAVKVLLAGSGELTEDLRRRAEQLDVPTHFTGFLNQTELWQAYVPADAFVLPSDTGETWGLVTNEAMLFGLPVVVSSEVGCAEDLVIPGETGYTFTGGAVELADELEKLAHDPIRAKAMGERGRAHVLKHYSMEVATDGLMKAIRAVTH